MSVKIVRLGAARVPDEGIRIGTVRRPPRGVRRSQLSAENWYDVWFPNLAPSQESVRLGRSADTPEKWALFAKRYRAEMSKPPARHDLALLAKLSHVTHFSVGCYCKDETRCHRSLLRELLIEQGALMDP